MGLNGWEYYLFAFFVFILLCVLVLIIVKSYKSADKRSKLADMDREERILNLYGKVDDMLEAVEDYIEESKKQIDEQALKAEQASLRAQEYLRMAATYHAQTVAEAQVTSFAANETPVRIIVDESAQRVKELKPVPVKQRPKAEKKAAEPAPRGVMMGQVNEMDIAGKTIDEIAEQLGHSKGEIAFMLNLMGSRTVQPAARAKPAPKAQPAVRPKAEPAKKQPIARVKTAQSITALPFEEQLAGIKAQVDAARPNPGEKKPSTVLKTAPAKEVKSSMTVDELTQRLRKASATGPIEEKADVQPRAEKKTAVKKAAPREAPAARKAEAGEAKVRKTAARPAGEEPRAKKTAAKPVEETKVRKTAGKPAEKKAAAPAKRTEQPDQGAKTSRPAETKVKKAAPAAARTPGAQKTVKKAGAPKAPVAEAPKPAAPARPKTGAVIREPKKNVKVQKRA